MLLGGRPDLGQFGGFEWRFVFAVPAATMPMSCCSASTRLTALAADGQTKGLWRCIWRFAPRKASRSSANG